jgi:hypothetical protein
VNCYQLPCGCWQSDLAIYGTGGVFPCLRHGQVLIIGMTAGAQWQEAA